MELFILNVLNNNHILEEPSKKLNDELLSNKSYDEETIPDDDFNKGNKKRD